MFPGLAIDYTRSMKVNTAVEWLVQESFQLCSAMQVATAQSLCCFFSPKLVAAEQLKATLTGTATHRLAMRTVQQARRPI